MNPNPNDEQTPVVSNGVKNQIEAILFVANKPLTAKALAKILEADTVAAQTALDELINSHKESGIVLLQSSEGYQLASNPKNSTAVKNFLNMELREKLTDATVEVLAIIAYRQPISKAELEAIRLASIMLTSSLDLQTVLNSLLDNALRLVHPANDAHVFLYKNARLSLGCARGWVFGRV